MGLWCLFAFKECLTVAVFHCCCYFVDQVVWIVAFSEASFEFKDR